MEIDFALNNGFLYIGTLYIKRDWFSFENFVQKVAAFLKNILSTYLTISNRKYLQQTECYSVDNFTYTCVDCL